MPRSLQMSGFLVSSPLLSAILFSYWIIHAMSVAAMPSETRRGRVMARMRKRNVPLGARSRGFHFNRAFLTSNGDPNIAERTIFERQGEADFLARQVKCHESHAPSAGKPAEMV